MRLAAVMGRLIIFFTNAQVTESMTLLIILHNINTSIYINKYIDIVFNI